MAYLISFFTHHMLICFVRGKEGENYVDFSRCICTEVPILRFQTFVFGQFPFLLLLMEQVRFLGLLYQPLEVWSVIWVSTSCQLITFMTPDKSLNPPGLYFLIYKLKVMIQEISKV